MENESAPSMDSIRRPAPHAFCAGDYVDVVDTTSRFDRASGVVEFFVADNVYVKFPALRGKPTAMFFADQLRPAAAPQELRIAAKAAGFFRQLRMSLPKLRP